MTTTSVRPSTRKLAAAMVAAGILYNSWPLGYLLNWRVGAHGLASELEAIGQPYNWLFIVLDVLSGGIIVIGGWLLLAHRRQAKLGLAMIGSIAALILFGATTIAAALLPMDCVPALRACTMLDNDPVFIAHGITSIVSAVALIMSVLLAERYLHFWRGIPYVALAGLVVLGMYVVVSYVNARHGASNGLQYAFLLDCGVWVALFPFVVRHIVAQARLAPAVVRTRTGRK